MGPSLFEALIVHLLNKIPALSEPEGSLLYSQQPLLYPIPSKMNKFTPSYPVSLISILILSSHLHLGLPSGLFLLGFSTQSLLCISVCFTNTSFFVLYSQKQQKPHCLQIMARQAYSRRN